MYPGMFKTAAVPLNRGVSPACHDTVALMLAMASPERLPPFVGTTLLQEYAAAAKLGGSARAATAAITLTLRFILRNLMDCT